MNKTIIAFAAALCSVSLSHAATTFIDFEDIPDGSTVSNEYAGVVFSSNRTDVEVNDYGVDWGTSAPNVICPRGDRRGYCSASLIVDFTTLVTAVDYLFTGDDSSGQVGTARYFGSDGTLLGTHALFGDGNAFTAHAEGFAFAGGIAQLVISVASTEATLEGLGYDDFRLAPVPEPEVYALMLAGLGLLSVAQRRRG